MDWCHVLAPLLSHRNIHLFTVRDAIWKIKPCRDNKVKYFILLCKLYYSVCLTETLSFLENGLRCKSDNASILLTFKLTERQNKFSLTGTMLLHMQKQDLFTINMFGKGTNLSRNKIRTFLHRQNALNLLYLTHLE